MPTDPESADCQPTTKKPYFEHFWGYRERLGEKIGKKLGRLGTRLIVRFSKDAKTHEPALKRHVPEQRESNTPHNTNTNMAQLSWDIDHEWERPTDNQDLN